MRRTPRSCNRRSATSSHRTTRTEAPGPIVHAFELSQAVLSLTVPRAQRGWLLIRTAVRSVLGSFAVASRRTRQASVSFQSIVVAIRMSGYHARGLVQTDSPPSGRGASSRLADPPTLSRSTFRRQRCVRQRRRQSPHPRAQVSRSSLHRAPHRSGSWLGRCPSRPPRSPRVHRE